MDRICTFGHHRLWGLNMAKKAKKKKTKRAPLDVGPSDRAERYRAACLVAAQLHASGDSYAQIARRLTRDKYPTIAGGVWNYHNVKKAIDTASQGDCLDLVEIPHASGKRPVIELADAPDCPECGEPAVRLVDGDPSPDAIANLASVAKHWDALPLGLRAVVADRLADYLITMLEGGYE